MSADDVSYMLVGGIPSHFHSAHLRAFFSNFVEKNGFSCFHYRHRPEYLAVNDEAKEVPKASRTNCCIICVRKGLEKMFLGLYKGKHWTGLDEKMLPFRVRIKNVLVDCNETDTKQELSTGFASLPHRIPWSELSVLPELTPPSVMPQGNVGTPLRVFMDLIRQCKLPVQVIRKLRLEFPKSRTQRRYGAVHLDYGTDVRSSHLTKPAETDNPSSLSISQGFAINTNHESDSDGDNGHHGDYEDDDDDDDDDDDGDDVEEWDRYEALHEDVDKQGRTEERLHEEELEVVWEKGGSGLVFYTDASYWDHQDGDFDEKCSKEDDWDVDMGGYYSYEGADKDARDLRDMQIENRLRDHADELLSSWRIGQFEKHTKGIGSKLLKKAGWKEGTGVGVSTSGIAEPLDVDGQLPFSKRGLGYRGESVFLDGPEVKRAKSSRQVVISTIYDKPDEEESNPLRTAPSRTIKYRDSVKFTKGGILKETSTCSTPRS